MELEVKFHPAPGSTPSPNFINCTNTGLRLRPPDDGQKDCPKTYTVVIPIKLERGASVGFIHKETKLGVYMHILLC